jgi:hypothetical protein
MAALPQGLAAFNLASMKHLSWAMVVLFLAACSSSAPPVCTSGHTAIETQLYFGLSTKGGTVSAQEWQSFVAREITPRFPEGFTVTDGRGFWLGTAKKTISENSKIITRIHDADAKDDAAIAAIIADYKRQFAQESVLRVDLPVCAAF